MKHLETLWSNNYDYDAVFSCEFCGSCQVHKNCYSDNNFSKKVIPAIRCMVCTKRTDDSLGEERVGEGILVEKNM